MYNIIRMWDPNRLVFHVGGEDLSISDQDIYFLTIFFGHGVRVVIRQVMGGGRSVDGSVD